MLLITSSQINETIPEIIKSAELVNNIISTITKVFRHLYFVKLRIIRMLKECVSNIK